jgi:hypothetical protein
VIQVRQFFNLWLEVSLSAQFQFTTLGSPQFIGKFKVYLFRCSFLRFDPQTVRYMTVREIPLAPSSAKVGLDIRVSVFM